MGSVEEHKYRIGVDVGGTLNLFGNIRAQLTMGRQAPIRMRC
jgi:outer membrane receptor for ferric coprogen and ferric-rhodotorulic acid